MEVQLTIIDFHYFHGTFKSPMGLWLIVFLVISTLNMELELTAPRSRVACSFNWASQVPLHGTSLFQCRVKEETWIFIVEKSRFESLPLTLWPIFLTFQCLSFFVYKIGRVTVGIVQIYVMFLVYGMKSVFNIEVLIIFLSSFIYFETKKVWVEEGQGERESQAGSALSAGRLIQGWNPWTIRSWPEPKLEA